MVEINEATAARQIDVSALEFKHGEPPTVAPELREDIERRGILHPLSVFATKGGGYRVELGNQRLAIARELGMATVPCDVYGEGIPREDRTW